MTAGYSKTPLVKKLGIKPESSIYIFNPPMAYQKLVADLPEDLSFNDSLSEGVNFVHLFTKSKDELEGLLIKARELLAQNGVIWVSWPKKSSKVPTDITEDAIREVALPIDFVDIKVCAVDEVWSGLKLVIRKEKRKSLL